MVDWDGRRWLHREGENSVHNRMAGQLHQSTYLME